MGINSLPLLADLFLHTSDDFMLTTMKQDITKAVSFGYTFRYDLFSVNNEGFGDIHQCYLPVGTGIEGNHHGIQWSVSSRHKNETPRRQNTLSYQRLRQEKWLQLSDRQFPLYGQQHPSQSGLWGAHISSGEVCQDSYMKGGLHTEAPSALVTPPATRIQMIMPCYLNYLPNSSTVMVRGTTLRDWSWKQRSRNKKHRRILCHMLLIIIIIIIILFLSCFL